MHHTVFWLYTNFSEEHAASILRANVRRVRNLMSYIGLGQGSDQEQYSWTERDTHFLLIQPSFPGGLLPPFFVSGSLD
jgi:hypothetical protein